MRAHEEALKAGGVLGIIDENRVRSAVARPYDGYHRRIYEKAAALVESLIQNHGFADGNKRTALYLVNVLIEKSGYRLDVDTESIVKTLVAVAEGNENYYSLVDWFRERLHRSSESEHLKTSESNGVG